MVILSVTYDDMINQKEENKNPRVYDKHEILISTIYLLFHSFCVHIHSILHIAFDILSLNFYFTWQWIAWLKKNLEIMNTFSVSVYQKSRSSDFAYYHSFVLNNINIEIYESLRFAIYMCVFPSFSNPKCVNVKRHRMQQSTIEQMEWTYFIVAYEKLIFALYLPPIN